MTPLAIASSRLPVRRDTAPVTRTATTPETPCAMTAGAMIAASTLPGMCWSQRSTRGDGEVRRINHMPPARVLYVTIAMPTIVINASLVIQHRSRHRAADGAAHDVPGTWQQMPGDERHAGADEPRPEVGAPAPHPDQKRGEDGRDGEIESPS